MGEKPKHKYESVKILVGGAARCLQGYFISRLPPNELGATANQWKSAVEHSNIRLTDLRYYIANGVCPKGNLPSPDLTEDCLIETAPPGQRTSGPCKACALSTFGVEIQE